MKKSNGIFSVTTASGAAYTLLAGFAVTAPGNARADDVLPVPAVTGWVGAGQATGVVSGTTFNVNQTSQNVSLNWQSFNIGSENTVNFLQPSETSIALNRIFQLNPVDIRGKLNANGEVYLLSQNGIVFGETAQVNVRGLIASTLNITPSAENLGLTGAIGSGAPAFTATLDADGNVLSRDVEVVNGARITTPSGGRVFMFAPNVTNDGTIKTPDGQTALAAGNKIYLTTTDPSIRGLVVEVDEGGTVTNGAVTSAGTTNAATIQADRGNVSLVGLAVNQNGRVSASTAVRSGGSIRLMARESVPLGIDTRPITGGTLTFGANSITEANPDLADKEATLDANPQPRGRIEAFGNQIFARSGSSIAARSGEVKFEASPTGGDADNILTSDSRIYLESGSSIDVSGEFVDLPAERNALTVRLQGSELRDSPVQRDSALRGQLVTVDVRRRGTTADGRSWVGTPLADLNEASQGVRRTVGERSSTGGTVTLNSQGDVIAAEGSSVDVSGGGLRYADGGVQTTLLVRNGVITDIGAADPNLAYDGIFGAAQKVHARWGVVEQFQSAFFGGASASAGTGSYFEGKDAGNVVIGSSRIVLDGDLEGRATRGEFQRQPTSATVTGPQRPRDQVPRSGRLTLGFAGSVSEEFPDFGLGSATFGLQPILPNVPAFDPLHDPMPELAADVTIPVQIFGEDNFGGLELYANARVDLPSGINLNLGPGGEMEIVAGEIALDGQVTARGGAVSMTARRTVDVENSNGNITLSQASGIDVSGLWTNDMQALQRPGMPFDRLSLAGGSVRIEARPEEASEGPTGLFFNAGSHIDADGGAWVNTAGRVTAGNGGNISLLTRRGIIAEPVSIALDGSLSAFGLENGGTLTVQASDVCVATVLCAGASAESTAWLTPDFLANGGFRSYSLVADGGSVTFADGTRIELSQLNRQLEADYATYADRSDLAEFSTVGRLPDIQRRPVDLSASVRVRFADTGGFLDEDLRAAGYLNFGTGAEILAETGARINFSSDTRMFVDGTISAPAGAINLTVTSAINGTRFGEFMPSQSLWLGSEAALLAPGASRILTDELGRRNGDVLAAGVVRLDARSGYVVAEQGSRIDVSGVSDELDITSVGGPGQDVSPQRTTVAADAGQIEIKAAEGILFAGSLEASAAGIGARSGGLLIELNTTDRNDDTNGPSAEQLGLSTTPRTIVVSIESMDDLWSELDPGAPIGSEHNSRAVISPGLITNGRFGDVTLRTRNFDRGVPAPGRIRFEGDVGLAAARRLTLDAAGIESNGGRAMLNAPYVAIGHQDTRSDAIATAVPDLVPRGGSLSVSADLIDIFGSSRLLGFRSANLSSRGDIRLRGLQVQGRTDVSGRLESTGDLNFAARQIYAPTLNEFTVAVRDNPEGRITIDSTGASTPVLSAGSHLTFEAADILQRGVIKAPLGEIVLNASRDLNLADGSITSTSLENQLVPFGRIEVGTDWVYALDAAGAGALRLIFTEQANRPADELPRQNVHLEAPSVTLAEGAVLDQSGGGDLFGYEFESGLSGSVDVLDPVVAPRNYAVVPELAAGFAPIDAQESLLFGLRPGESVEFASDLPGLPSGRYALLPARYALLPGAFLVTAVSGYSDLAPGAVLPFAQGGSVIAGRRVFADGLEGDLRTSGFVIRNQTDIARLAKYDTYRANTFAAGFGGMPLPRDGGSTQIEAALNLELGGSIRAAGAAGGRGATVEITGDRLAVVADRNQHLADPGSLLLEADGLNGLGAESLILGGTRRFDADGAHLDVTALQVEIDGGVSLEAPEIILAATDTVRVESDAQITGAGTSGAATQPLSVAGDGALLRVSGGSLGDFSRSAANGTSGTLEIENNAVILADGSTLLSGALDVRFDGTLQMEGGSLAVDAARINLGDPDIATAGFTFTADDFTALDVDDLRLSAREGLHVYEPLEVRLARLRVKAPTIAGHLATGERAILVADEFILSNPSFAAAPRVPAGTGAFEIQADNIGLGIGQYAIDGFGSVRLSANDTLTALGASGVASEPQAGHLNVSGDLNLTAGLITGQSNAELAIAATGAVRIDASGASPTVAAVRELGAILSITGKSVEDFARVELYSGSLSLRATGTLASDGVTVGQGASISVAGSHEQFADKDVFARAGAVTLVSDHGDVQLLPGATIDVAGAAAGGNAGRLEVRASAGDAVVAGTVRGGAAEDYAGGAFVLDTNSVGSFSALNSLLEGAGFDGERVIRLRTGDISLGAGETLNANRVSLTADTGNVAIGGAIDASGANAGSIELNGLNDVALLSGGTLSARSTEAGNRGGAIALRSLDGAVRVNNGANIDVTAAAATNETAADAAADRGGILQVRLKRDAALTLVDGNTTNDQLVLAGAVSGARRIDVEAYERYVEADGELDASDVSVGNARFNDAAAFIGTHGAGIRTALGSIASQTSFHLRPGIEIVTDASTPDLRLGSTWDLSQWRFGGEAGVLTLRTTGNLSFGGSLSDGFAGVADLTQNVLPILGSDDSWSYRLVAGADSASANLLATTGDPALGNLSIAPGTVGAGTIRPRLVAVRTGTGSIDVAAAGDVTLGNRASVIYTAGRDLNEGIRLGSARGTLENRPYPLQGGDISVVSGGAVRGVAPDQTDNLTAYGNQLITPWLYRQGASDESATGPGRRATGWTVAFERFEQGIGALAGGNVSVIADGEINNLAVSIPSIGIQVGSNNANNSVVREVGGGDLVVRAGGDIVGGVFFVGKGNAAIDTLGSVVSGRAMSDSMIPLHTLLALGAGQIALSARGGIDLESVVNPTLLPQGPTQKSSQSNLNSFFSTYVDDSSVTLASLAGDVKVHNNAVELKNSNVFGLNFTDDFTNKESLSLTIYPPAFEASAMRGDIHLNNAFTLYPSPQGDVQLLAEGSIFVDGSLLLSDVNPDALPSVARPSAQFAKFSALSIDARTFGAIPLHASMVSGEPARFIARTGDIARTGENAALVLTKETLLSAGRDLVGLNVLIQNVNADDVSILRAGRDLVYPSLRAPQGIILPSSAGIDIQGPGRMQIEAGRDIDLGASRGISSLGDSANPALADQGADITLLAGLNGNAPALDAFAAKYDVAADLPVVLDKFYAILREAGRKNAPLPNEQRSYAEAFDAIKTLFPAADYQGSMDMFFSRVYTIDGGDIDLLLPGGGVNVGLAAPPSAFGVNKEASQLGLVAQSSGTVRAFLDQNFEVNESRVFAADGGDILVWSSNGDIDAGRGAKTSISAPPPIITVDPTSGLVTVTFPPALTGSGIRTLTSTPGRAFGSVDLITPRGVVDASEAGIETLGNLTIAAVEVLGTQNIKVGGASSGVPVDTGGLAASLSNVSSVSNSANAAADVDAGGEKTNQAPIADSAMSFLEVFVLGFGEGVCDPKDAECLKRQQLKESPQ